MRAATVPAISKFGDIAGGVTTFFTMAYIVVVNPGILSTSGTGISFSGALTATVLIAFSMTTLPIGLYARLPFAVAPGMGINAFFAYTIVLQNEVPWQTALGMVFWAGVLFLLVWAAPLRERVAMSIPPGLRVAAAGGIGLLLTFIGFRNAGLVAADPATLVRLGVLDHRAAFLLLGIVVAVVLLRRHSPFAFLAAIFTTTHARMAVRFTAPPAELTSPPDFSSVFLRLDVFDALQWALLPAIVAILFTDLFDRCRRSSALPTPRGSPTRTDGRPICGAA